LLSSRPSYVDVAADVYDAAGRADLNPVVEEYNLARPHPALEMKVPADVPCTLTADLSETG